MGGRQGKQVKLNPGPLKVKLVSWLVEGPFQTTVGSVDFTWEATGMGVGEGLETESDGI